MSIIKNGWYWRECYIWSIKLGRCQIECSIGRKTRYIVLSESTRHFDQLDFDNGGVGYFSFYIHSVNAIGQVLRWIRDQRTLIVCCWIYFVWIQWILIWPCKRQDVIFLFLHDIWNGRDFNYIYAIRWFRPKWIKLVDLIIVDARKVWRCSQL